ncbi:iron-sulfur cluster assembly scaffold protein [Nanoarchaeota archaeon]
MSLYSEKIMQNFKNPTHLGKPEKYDGHGKIGNILCGDVTDIYIIIEDNRLKDVKFETLGCAAAIATANVLAEIAIGKTLDEAILITTKDIVDYLEDLPESKHHCSELAEGGIKEAIYNYLKKNNKAIPETLSKQHEKALKEQEEFNKKFTREYRDDHDCVCDEE